jgi:hypothetical protein
MGCTWWTLPVCGGPTPPACAGRGWGRRGLARYIRKVPTEVISDVTFRSLQRDEVRPLSEWTTTFQLFVVALDPYTQQSAWILPTAVRLLREYAEADCRVGFLMVCDPDDARQFLGPLAEEFMVFIDSDRATVRAIGLTSLPALVHIDQSPAVVGAAEGWDTQGWRAVAMELSKILDWTPPGLPNGEDPGAFAGTPVDGPSGTS